MMPRNETGRPGEERKQLRVLVVDDSAMVRQMMQAILGSDLRIKVTTAADPLIAWEKMQKERPDVIITDLEMPHMDGLSFVRKIMMESPIPVVVCSGLAGRGTELALRALEQGAVEIITKPKLGVKEFLQESSVRFLDAVWSAAEARVVRRVARPPVSSSALDAAVPALLRPGRGRLVTPASSLIAIGASTGGPEALRIVLTAMPADGPPVVVVQHMPEEFTRLFAARLNGECRMQVRQAQDGDLLETGTALIAPGNFHTSIENSSEGLMVKVTDGPLVCRHRPSVDVLFRSVAAVAARSAVGIIITGMGADGAQGLLEMKAAGASTIAQDEASCVVFGMPREAIARGAADCVLPLEQIAARALQLARSRREVAHT